MLEGLGFSPTCSWEHCTLACTLREGSGGMFSGATKSTQGGQEVADSGLPGETGSWPATHTQNHQTMTKVPSVV